MRKADTIRMLLDQGLTAAEVAREANCSLSWAYAVRQRQELGRLEHELGVLQQELSEIYERIATLEGKPADIVERMLAKNRNG